MNEGMPSIEAFKANIESLFGQKLTEPASKAAEDFWENWDSFGELIDNRSLSVHVDPIFLSHNFPQYNRYKPWKGSGKIFIILSIIPLWFIWRIGLFLLVVGIGLHFWGTRIMVKDAKDFTEELMKDATLNPLDGGYERLCANYISGIIKFVSPMGSSHWPQFPSNVITGENSFIPP